MTEEEYEATKKIVDFQTRKSVHINMTRATHSEYRKLLLDYSLSMQEVFELFARLAAEGDQRAVSIIEEAYTNKKYTRGRADSCTIWMERVSSTIHSL